MGKISAFLILAFLMIFPVLSQADDERTISGTVTDVDWVSSGLTVRYYDPYSGGMDELTVRVPREARINRGTKSISFSDIRQSDRVTVTYYSDDLSGLKAKRVSDLNQGNR